MHEKREHYALLVLNFDVSEENTASKDEYTQTPEPGTRPETLREGRSKLRLSHLLLSFVTTVTLFTFCLLHLYHFALFCIFTRHPNAVY